MRWKYDGMMHHVIKEMLMKILPQNAPDKNQYFIYENF